MPSGHAYIASFVRPPFGCAFRAAIGPKARRGAEVRVFEQEAVEFIKKSVVLSIGEVIHVAHTAIILRA